jgi:hypothetical protein
MNFNLSQAVAVGSAVAQLLPVAAQMVQAVENAMPAGTPGATKLDAVKVGLNSVYTLAGAAEVQFAQLWPHLQVMINGFVTVFNRLGIFKKADVATAVTATVATDTPAAPVTPTV